MVTRLAPTAKPAASIATRPAAPARGSATPAPAKPASKPASKHAGKPMGERVANALLSTRVVSSPKPAPVDSFWYKCKKALATVFCNLTTPKLETRTLATGNVPAGLEATLKPGDVFVRRTEGTSGNFFIPSWWKHAAVYVGNGEVVEATFAGVKKTSLEEFFAHGDSVAAVRAPNLTDTQRASAARYAEASIGKPYDFDVDFDDDSRVTCTELAYHALIAATGKPVVQKNWMDVVVGDNFFDGMQVLYNSAPEHGGAAK